MDLLTKQEVQLLLSEYGAPQPLTQALLQVKIWVINRGSEITGIN